MPGSFRMKSRRAAVVSALALAASGTVAVRADSATVIGGGFAHSCAVIFDGTVRCWGNNSGGLLGIGLTSEPRLSPVAVKRLRNVVSIATGDTFNCVLLRSATVDCWGGDNGQQLGDGKMALWRGIAPVPGVRHAIEVSAGLEHGCALRSDRTVLCWGTNDHGQLGIGGTPHAYGGATPPMPPVQVSGLHTAIAISADWFQTCALLAGGTVDCWGLDYDGELAPGGGYPLDDRVVPTPVPGVSGAIAISAGAGHACALINDGTIKCWGYTNAGLLGDGTTADGVSLPVNVSGITHAVAVSAGGGGSCALIADGSVWCWGGNSRGQVGVGTTISYYATPMRVHGVRDAVAIDVGNNHACAVLVSGDVKCWGENIAGQIGNGRRTTAQTTPALVRNLNGSVAGAFHSCGTVHSGSAYRIVAAGHTSCAQARGVFRRYRAAHRRVHGWRCAASGRSVRCRRGSTTSQVGWTR
jgi:alpha-tubulin suppressor-like RCC1 family protein